MATEEHLSILKQGVEVWNKWREENSKITNPDLSGADLKGRDLNWANLSGANLNGANLSEAKLVWANFDDASLEDANLSKADLSKSTFNNANLSGANLEEAVLNRANLEGANLDGVNFDGADLEAAKIELDSPEEAEEQSADANEDIEAASTQDDKTAEKPEDDAETADEEAEEITAALSDAVESTEETADSDVEATAEETEEIEDTASTEDKAEENTPVESFSEKSDKEKSAAKNPRLKWMIAAGLAVLAAVSYFVWAGMHHDLLVVVSKDANPYVYLDGEFISKTSEEDGHYHFHIKDQYRGEHELKVYSTQLKDLETHDFVRYKLYEKTVDVTGDEDLQKHVVQLDTLYSIRHIADGKFPNINPEGTKLVYVKLKQVGNQGQFSKELFTYDLKEKKETKIALKNRAIYGADWEWDRPYLRNNDDHIFLSAYSFKSRNTYIYIVDAETGNLKRIPINLRKNYLKYLPLKEPAGLLVENKIYSLSGKHKQSFNFEAPFLDEVFYAGNNGFMFLRDKKTEGSRSFTLECTYINLEKMQAKVLFEVPKNRPPFLSASKDAQKVAVSDYSGITVQFFSTIKLWADNEFAPLTNEFVDGERDYSDGTRLHKTEACADDLVQNIVFEYENKVYLINIPSENTIEDLMRANMTERERSFADSRVMSQNVKG